MICSRESSQASPDHNHFKPNLLSPVSHGRSNNKRLFREKFSSSHSELITETKEQIVRMFNCVWQRRIWETATALLQREDESKFDTFTVLARRKSAKIKFWKQAFDQIHFCCIRRSKKDENISPILSRFWRARWLVVVNRNANICVRFNFYQRHALKIRPPR